MTVVCDCGHPAHHHPAGGPCATTKIFGDATNPPADIDAELHLGRWQRKCQCAAMQPGTGATGANQETHSKETT